MNWRELISQGVALAILTGLIGAGVYAIMRAAAPRWPERDVATFVLSLAAVGMFSTRIGEALIDDLRAALAFAVRTLAHAVAMLVCLIRPASVLAIFVSAVVIIHTHASPEYSLPMRYIMK